METQRVALIGNADFTRYDLAVALDAGGFAAQSLRWDMLSSSGFEEARIEACILQASASELAPQTRYLRSLGFSGVLIACSDEAEQRCEIEALDAGADSYFLIGDPLTLLARLRACLRARRAFGLARVGDITLGATDAEVCGIACGLTRRELSLLELLAQARDGIVTREEILKRWSLSAAQGGNLIDVHVARLRRKLGRAGGQLRTVRGRGLRLSVQSADEAAEAALSAAQ